MGMWAEEATLSTMATSGTIVEDIITFATAGNGSNQPQISSGQLRLYANSSADMSTGVKGGSITFTAAEGYVISQVTLAIANDGNSNTTAGYQINGTGSWIGSANNVVKNTNYSTADNLNASTVEIANFGTTTRSNRIYITSITVKYSAKNATAYTVTFNAGTNGTCSTSSLTESSAGKGVTLPSCTANTGYKFLGWTATKDNTAIDNGLTAGATYKPSANTTLYAVYAICHTITWSVNGNTTTIAPSQVEDGANIAFPTGIEDSYGKKFVGWSANENASAATDLVSGAVAASENKTYYAVFADESGSTELTKLGSDASFTEGDNIVIVANNGGNKYMMYQETVSTSYVKYVALTEEPTYEAIIEDSKNYFTLTANSSNWYLGDDTNGYVYSSSSNNLAVVIPEEGTSMKVAFSIAWDDTKEGFSLKYGSRWLSCRTDLTGDNKYKYRLGGDGSTPIGVGYFDLYRIEDNTVYSNYTTTPQAPVPTTLTITLNAACTDGEFVYGTYSSDKAFVVPSDLIVYEVALIDGEIMKEAYETSAVVPANTGVLVAAEKGGDYSVDIETDPETLELAESVLGEDNALRPSGNGITAEEMDTDNGNCLYYRLTMQGGTKIGFWWGAADGAAFGLAANKAYLVAPKSAGAKGFAFNGTTTLIDAINASKKAEGTAYNLAGQRVNANMKGIVIINGNKYINK